jgi:hypothetical protein
LVYGSTLTSTTGTWTGTATMDYAYQWRRTTEDIQGAISATYVITKADAQRGLTCRVTASNSEGVAGEISNSVTGSSSRTTSGRKPKRLRESEERYF